MIMIRRLFAVLALVALLPAAAAAADPRGNADAALAGTWSVSWNSHPGGLTIGGHYVQVHSDRRVHWTDSVRDIRTARLPSGELDLSARCDATTELSPDDFAAMRDVVRAIYDVQIPDGSSGPKTAFLSVTVTRGVRRYIVGLVNYVPGDENLDPRLKRAHAIFARYACPSVSSRPRPAG
jgi:hypothetical protein